MSKPRCFILLFFLSFGVSAFAKDFLKQSQPPTPSELLDSFNEFPKQNPWKNFEAENYEASAIATIAGLESVYPGAVWAPLGRDAFIAGDLLDAFYAVNGERGRVTRLRASTATFSGAKQKTLVRFLESGGANFNPKDKTARPFVLIDRTNFRVSSQSNILLRAAYQEWKRRGGAPEDFVYRFGVVDLSGMHETLGNTDMDVRFYLHQQAQILKAGGDPSDLSILSVQGLSDGPTWHGTYGKFRKHGDGFYGTPGRFESGNKREDVLGLQFMFLGLSHSPRFKSAVKRAIEKLKPQTTSAVTSEEWEAHQLKKLSRSLNAEGSLKDVFFAKGLSLFERFTDEQFRLKHQPLFTKLVNDELFQRQIHSLAIKMVSIPTKESPKKLVQFYMEQVLSSKKLVFSLWQDLKGRMERDVDWVIRTPLVQKWFLRLIENPNLRYSAELMVKGVLKSPRLLESKSGRAFFLDLVPSMKKMRLHQNMPAVYSVEYSKYQSLLQWDRQETKFSIEPFEAIAKDQHLTQEFIEGRKIRQFCSGVLSRL